MYPILSLALAAHTSAPKKETFGSPRLRWAVNIQESA